MVAAAFGHTHVHVRAQPRVVIIGTGDELKEPGTQLRPGEIYNSSKFFLMAATQAAGLRDVSSITVSDDPNAAGQAIAAALRDVAGKPANPTLLVTTGAVSAGVKDFVPELARNLGFETLFHKVAIRPGKPVFAAKRGAHMWLGLPGNPISTAATWHYFARPLLAAWAGVPPPQKITMTLTTNVRKPEGLRCFFRAHYNKGLATVHQSQGSAHFRASTTANAYVEIPEGGTEAKSGMVVEGLLIS